MPAYSGFIEKGYSPKVTDLVAEFRLSPNRVSFATAANAVAGESSIGTWTPVKTEDRKMARKLKPKIFRLSSATGKIKIAYPQELFEAGNISQMMSSIGGNVLGMKIVNSLRLEDIAFPKSHLKKFKGPKFGVAGVRKTLGIKNRPLVGTIVKPKLGLSASKHAKVAYNAWVGGCDVVKDDENLSSMSFNGFKSRITATLNALDKAETKTHDKKAYLPNISAPYNEMIERAEFVKQHAGKFLMVDVVTVGWSALQSLRDENFNLVFHAHRAGHAAFTRSKTHGISMLVLAKLCRLAGMDQLHVGTAVGKMEGPEQEVREIVSAVQDTRFKNWLNLKPMFAVASGGLYPALVPKLIKFMGTDIIIQAGGGVHGHPQGTKAGAAAMLQVVSAVMNKADLRKYALFHPQLKAALAQWK